jgi:hypothetical protein
MAYGPVGGTEYIWLLYGNPPEDHGYFARYDIDMDDWEALERMPQQPEHTAWGGALTYVPDPYACPPSGWLFAFKGNKTSEFWCYIPSTDEWHKGPDLEIGAAIPVDGGAALCFGGYGYHQGFGYAYVYAFCGGGDNDRFFRYRFRLVPNDVDGGMWEELAGLNYYVDKGGALVRCSLPDSPTYTEGAVFAIRGCNSLGLYVYDVAEDDWDHAINHPDCEVGSGGALAAASGGWSFFGFPGSAQDEWWYYDVAEGTFYTFEGEEEVTWALQHAGAAIAYDGDYVYAEVGTNDGEFWRCEYPQSFGGGGQGSVAGQVGKPAVMVRSDDHAHTFLVTRATPGPVRLQVVAADGRVCHFGEAPAGAERAALVWNHEGVAPGVYLYLVTAAGMQTSGKLTVVK